jgi:hypothetical protein
MEQMDCKVCQDLKAQPDPRENKALMVKTHRKNPGI